MLETLGGALAEAQIAPSGLSGIGVAVPGPVNPRKGTVIEMPNLGWNNLALGDVLTRELQCPAHILNDVDAGIYGEYRFGAGKEGRCVLGVFPGTGIGGGCVYEGSLLQGGQRTCMEIGHIRVQPNGPRCGCGGRGCLEAVASRLAISQAVAAAAYRGDAPTILREAGTNLREIRSGVLADAVKAGDKAVVAILNDAARWLGIGVAACVNLLNPDIIVLGGGLVEALPDLYLKGVRASTEEHAMRSFEGTYKIVTAELGDDASAQGAAAWARHVEMERP
jgi:glucokinase